MKSENITTTKHAFYSNTRFTTCFITINNDWRNDRNPPLLISCPNLFYGVMVMKWDKNSLGNALVNVFGNV